MEFVDVGCDARWVHEVFVARQQIAVEHEHLLGEPLSVVFEGWDVAVPEICQLKHVAKLAGQHRLSKDVGLMRQCALQLAHEAVVCTEVQAGISSELFAGCEADMLLEILVDGILGDASVSYRTKAEHAFPRQAG